MCERERERERESVCVCACGVGGGRGFQLRDKMLQLKQAAILS